MKRLLIVLFVLLFITPAIGRAQSAEVQAAFVRNGDLWVAQDGEEKKLTHTRTTTGNPLWSHDGRYVAFLQKGTINQQGELSNELWVYDTKTEKKRKVYTNAFNPQWSPVTHQIAFQHEGVLSISDLQEFYNISVGVGGYAWLPDGNGFILSSNANLTPEGWTNPVLYKKDIPEKLAPTMEEQAEKFFVLPKELTSGEATAPAIGAKIFRFSPSGNWMSFIVYPTASWSMDSNMLSAIRTNGSDFSVVDEVITGVGEPKWSPGEDVLAYIGGSGRLVFGFKNKALKMKEFPAAKTLTPDQYAELDFVWTSDESIITSRVKEGEWTNDPTKRPKPSLYEIDISGQKQQQVTEPPKGKGDYHPRYLPSHKRLFWLRGESLTDEHYNVWMAEQDGANASLFIENVETISVYEPN